MPDREMYILVLDMMSHLSQSQVKITLVELLNSTFSYTPSRRVKILYNRNLSSDFKPQGKVPVVRFQASKKDNCYKISYFKERCV